MEELTKKELLDYLEEISQQLNNIALDQIPFAISELYFKLENSVPISLIEKKIEELETMYDGLSKNPKEHLHSKTEYKIVIGVLQELLDERNNTEVRRKK